MATKKLDFRKEYPELYNPPSTKFMIIDVPDMKFFMIDGKGDPNTSQEFKDAIATLYPLSYGVKMPFKKKHTDKDYVVPPLEGLWYMENMAEFRMDNKQSWQWTLMMRVPDFIPDSDASDAIDVVKAKKNPPSIEKIRFEHFQEAKCVQIMYVGPFDAEPPTITKMHEWAKDQGYHLRGKHHEIYLSDLRRVEAERLKTILRQPIL